MPLRLFAVKNSLEALQMFSEALCQFAEVVQSADIYNVLPGTF